jgi:hypothetical protein
MTFFRIQLADRNPSDLLDPDNHYSAAYNGNAQLTRHGVSACESLEDLAEYLISGNAGAFASVAEAPYRWSIIEMEGHESDDPRGAVDPGEVLVIPTRIVRVTEAGQDFVDLMDEMTIRVFGEPENLWED